MYTWMWSDEILTFFSASICFVILFSNLHFISKLKREGRRGEGGEKGGEGEREERREWREGREGGGEKGGEGRREGGGERREGRGREKGGRRREGREGRRNTPFPHNPQTLTQRILFCCSQSHQYPHLQA